MSRYSIVFETIDDIEDFVEQASKCDFDIDIKYNHIIVDAKSIMGILSIGLGKSIDVICHMNDEEFEKFIKSLKAVA